MNETLTDYRKLDCFQLDIRKIEYFFCYFMIRYLIKPVVGEALKTGFKEHRRISNDELKALSFCFTSVYLATDRFRCIRREDRL